MTNGRQLAGAIAAALLMATTASAKVHATGAGQGATMGMTFATYGNPYLPLWEHVPDGEPRVFEDPDNHGKYRVYIIGSHDTNYRGYCGNDVHAWSAPVEDLSSWRDEGAIFSYKTGGKWDVMFAPDLVEVKDKQGKKTYYLYPHDTDNKRRGMVCKGDSPVGPFAPVNLNADGKTLKEGSVLGFDPSVYIEDIADPADPDYKTGFRAYAFWGFKSSTGAQLDPNTMYSVRPGTAVMEHFVPASDSYGVVRDPAGTVYSQVYHGEDLRNYNFFEASSIRKVGNKYVWIYSGYSGPDYGLPSTNSALRYAYGDTPVGPWKSGGVLVDSRAPVLSPDGTRIIESQPGHNTHGSLQLINGQWYVFYHRSPRGYGFARQAMVAPVQIVADERSVADGGRVVIRGYDPYAPKTLWEAHAFDGETYTGAECTSEGFHIFGLDPYRFYSAGYACYLSDMQAQQDSWDIWDNQMIMANVKGGAVIGYKYFGFGGLDKAAKGIQPFEGARRGNSTKIELFLRPLAKRAFKVSVWLDGAWQNSPWNGRKIAEVNIPAGSAATQYTADVASAVEGLSGKHAIFIVVEGDGSTPQLDFYGLGFSSATKKISRPEAPAITITAGGKALSVPTTPVRTTQGNGYTDYSVYEVKAAAGSKPLKVKATATDKSVKITVKQADSKTRTATVKADYNGIVKTYLVKF